MREKFSECFQKQNCQSNIVNSHWLASDCKNCDQFIFPLRSLKATHRCGYPSGIRAHVKFLSQPISTLGADFSCFLCLCVLASSLLIFSSSSWNRRLRGLRQRYWSSRCFWMKVWLNVKVSLFVQGNYWHVKKQGWKSLHASLAPLTTIPCDRMCEELTFQPPDNWTLSSDIRSGFLRQT